MTLHDILTELRRLAPEDTALEKDPVGLLIGTEDEREVTKVGVCLDATPAAAERAAQAGVGLVIAHHPLIYHPLKRIGADPISRAVATLVRHDIALYAMHTNWDAAADGINDTLAAALELQSVRPLGERGELRLLRIGNLRSPRPLPDFLHHIQTSLECVGSSALRFCADPLEKMISTIAVCGGAGAFLMDDARRAGADAYVTSDVRHHEFLEAAGMGLALIDAGHGATETPGMRALCRRLPQLLPGVEAVWIGEE